MLLETVTGQKRGLELTRSGGTDRHQTHKPNAISTRPMGEQRKALEGQVAGGPAGWDWSWGSVHRVGQLLWVSIWGRVVRAPAGTLTQAEGPVSVRAKIPKEETTIQDLREDGVQTGHGKATWWPEVRFVGRGHQRRCWGVWMGLCPSEFDPPWLFTTKIYIQNQSKWNPQRNSSKFSTGIDRKEVLLVKISDYLTFYNTCSTSRIPQLDSFFYHSVSVDNQEVEYNIHTISIQFWLFPQFC